MKKLKILIGAGGTGGHLLPAQQLAERLNPFADVMFAGFQLKESPYFAREKSSYVEIPSAPFKVGGWKCLFPLGKGFLKAIKTLRKEKPDYIFGFGSYHTAPLLAAAVLLRIPIVLYEANRTLGRVNRWIAPFAKKIAVQFPLESSHPKTVLVPLFPWIQAQNNEIGKEEARRYFGLDEHKPTILVFGGSQGASYLNEIVASGADLFEGYQFLHFAGSESAAEKTKLRYDRKKIRAVAKNFEKKMSYAYAAADVAICRSGAGTIAELIRYHLPAILIPYPFATDQHQKRNGEFFVGLGGGKMILQTNATIEKLVLELAQIDLKKSKDALKAYLEQRTGETPIEEIVR